MRQHIKKIGLSMILIGLMMSVFIGVKRIDAEASQQTAQIGIRYADVMTIAKETQNTVESVLKHFRSLGATTLMVRENTLIAPEAYLFGEIDKPQVQLVTIDDLSKQFPEYHFSTDSTYVAITEEPLYNRITKHLKLKDVPIEYVTQEAYGIIGIPTDETILTSIGTGYDQESISVAAELGYSISPEIRSWENPSAESIQMIVDELRGLPGLGYIYFEDPTVVGQDNEAMQELVRSYGLGFTEFYASEQQGFDALAYAARDEENRFNMIRMLTDEKVPSISTPNRIVRYELALTERGIRAFTFILDGEDTLETQIERLEQDVAMFEQSLLDKGYTITSQPLVYSYEPTPVGMLWVMGFVAIGYVLLLAEQYKVPMLGIALGSMLIVGYTVGLFILPKVAVQGMALCTAILIPVYAVASQIKFGVSQHMGQAIGTFLKISGITLVGGIAVVGLLSHAEYALGIEGFRGVKVASILPLMMIGGLFTYQYRHQLKLELKQLLQTRVKYWPILVILLIGAIGFIGMIYIMRTGNGEISDLEKWIRQGLDQLLGVRPRTKEFLIGHPLMLVVIYFGYRACYLPALLIAMIGQLSLLNTYAHIHTPLGVSFIRSAYGLGIGIIIGIILIQVVKFIFKVINKWIIKQK